MTHQYKYRCAIAPADGLRLQQDGQNLRVDIEFGNGTGHTTPVLLDREQALQLARDLADYVGLDKVTVRD
ncbi:hypothetical protein [Vibrio phage VP16C]|nr:hypothetical protein [Vibrio phage VP16C]